MALGIDFNTANSGNGDTLYSAFTKINNMFTTTTKLGNGDLTINDVRVGRGANNIVTNTAVGNTALNSNTTGNNNTSIGVSALKDNSDGFSNTAIGAYAMEKNQGGDENTAVGTASLYNNTSGYGNTACGKGALNANTIGANNTALGTSALAVNLVGNDNVAIGNAALIASLGSANTAVGHLAGQFNTNLNNTTCLGYNVQASASDQVVIGNTNVTTTILRGAVTADKDATFNSVKIGRGGANIGTNTAVGQLSLNANYSGYQNVAIGNQSLFSNGNGYYNTGIGVISLSNNVGFANCTGVGYDSQITADGQVQLGNASTTPCAYQALSLRSDERDKTEIRDTVLGLDFINELRAVDYKWDMREDYKTEMPTQGELSDEDFKILMDEWLESVKLNNLTHDGTRTRTRYHHGLIAQEVQNVIEASGVDFGGFQDHSVNGGQDVMSIGYTELIAPMIKAIQELTARINVLEGN